MSIKAVLFDIDGTLVDSNDAHVQVWLEVFRGAGTVLEPQAVHDQIGKGADNLVPALMPGTTKADQERLGEEHGRRFKRDHLAAVRPFPGARELLLRVREAGCRVVLASSASTAELEHYIELMDVRDVVAETTSSDDVENTKPAPDIFATALGKVTPLRPDEVIAVGDTPYDVEAAARCGVATVALRSGGFTDEVLLKAGALALYDDADALLSGFDTSPLAG